jgi:hypothetical protein
MFIEKKTSEGYHSLREQFLKLLSKNIKNDSFNKSEFALREALRKKMQKGELF